jgi:hypothetical protein
MTEAVERCPSCDEPLGTEFGGPLADEPDRRCTSCWWRGQPLWWRTQRNISDAQEVWAGRPWLRWLSWYWWRWLLLRSWRRRW